MIAESAQAQGYIGKGQFVSLSLVFVGVDVPSLAPAFFVFVNSKPCYNKSMLSIVIIFIITIIATALSSMSGGGASVINIPVFLWLGISYPLAIAAQKVSSAFWLLPASSNFLKGRKVDWLFLTIFSILGLVGSYLGVLVVLSVNQRIMGFVIGVLILVLVIHTYFKKDVGLKEQPVYSKARQSIAYIFAPILGFYESIFGSGNGIMFSIVALYTRGFDFIDALGYYFLVAFPWVVFAAILLIQKGYYDLSVMIPALLGSIIGGYFGSKFAKYKGNKFVKMMFIIVGGLLGLKLILGI